METLDESALWYVIIVSNNRTTARHFLEFCIYYRNDRARFRDLDEIVIFVEDISELTIRDCQNFWL